MTILPGKHGVSVRYPGRVYRRDLDEDLRALRRASVRRLVLLVTDEELARWGHLAIAERAARFGIDVRRAPLDDGCAPVDAAAMDAILELAREGRRDGDVAVACMGGVGRTGTVAACALVAAGLPARAAIRHVRAVRHPTAVETAEQQEFVAAYAARRAVPRRS
jgi:protein-tyrosine phosphatase